MGNEIPPHDLIHLLPLSHSGMHNRFVLLTLGDQVLLTAEYLLRSLLIPLCCFPIALPGWLSPGPGVREFAKNVKECDYITGLNKGRGQARWEQRREH